MIRDDIEAYQANKRTIAENRVELNGDMMTVDSVTGSMVEYPYIERSIMVRGRNVQRERKLRLENFVLQRQCARAEKFIAGIEDQHIRSLLYWHYIRGQSWTKVRKILRIRKVTKDALRKRADTFLQKQG